MQRIFGVLVANQSAPSTLSTVLVYPNTPRSIYQYSSLAPRLSGQNCQFFKFLLSLSSQKRLGHKENNTKYRSLTWKPRSHVRILIYRTWPIKNYSPRWRWLAIDVYLAEAPNQHWGEWLFYYILIADENFNPLFGEIIHMRTAVVDESEVWSSK